MGYRFSLNYYVQNKLRFQLSKQGREELPGLILQSLIYYTVRAAAILSINLIAAISSFFKLHFYSLQRLENRHLVKPVLADEKTPTIKGRVSQVGHQKKCLRLGIQLK
ncbi:unnamed protein product [Porites evermanni]|uniref:Uncharacterized protein n=1 Tax=Porites evermanni TaxID=104178 RepID=A0ABN8RWD2_9CNID|nr:unnamed protein product [Porites evermanni]